MKTSQNTTQKMVCKWYTGENACYKQQTI